MRSPLFLCVWRLFLWGSVPMPQSLLVLNLPIIALYHYILSLLSGRGEGHLKHFQLRRLLSGRVEHQNRACIGEACAVAHRVQSPDPISSFIIIGSSSKPYHASFNIEVLPNRGDLKIISDWYSRDVTSCRRGLANFSLPLYRSMVCRFWWSFMSCHVLVPRVIACHHSLQLPGF